MPAAMVIGPFDLSLQVGQLYRPTKQSVTFMNTPLRVTLLYAPLMLQIVSLRSP
jgi:hypothetical protein